MTPHVRWMVGWCHNILKGRMSYLLAPIGALFNSYFMKWIYVDKEIFGLIPKFMSTSAPIGA